MAYLGRAVEGVSAFGCVGGIDGGKEIKDPRKWVGSQLRGLRMQGMVDFPTITGATKR